MINLDQIFISGVTAGNHEQLNGTDAVVSCTVAGLTKALDSVTWKRTSNGELDVTTGVDGYTSAQGSYDQEKKTQTTYLTINATQNTEDATFQCVVESIEHGNSSETSTVQLKVFSKCIPASG